MNQVHIFFSTPQTRLTGFPGTKMPLIWRKKKTDRYFCPLGTPLATGVMLWPGNALKIPMLQGS